MSGIVEFIEARIAEDEAAAKRHAADASRAGWGDYPAHVLREVEAKRAILAEHQPWRLANRSALAQLNPNHPGEWVKCWTCGADGPYPCLTLLALAGVWSDHPDYRQEWRPWLHRWLSRS